jgi:curli biogenesis system outer membrane secretion channel CsgG
MKRTVVACTAIFFFVCLCQCHEKGIAGSLSSMKDNLASAGKTGGDPYKAMAQELYESSELPVNSKIAIMPFTYGKDKKSDVGIMISERLTTRIVKLHKFKVIERQMLENVMQELHLEGSGIADAETTKKLGKVLGVEAIITGTVLDIDANKAEINARVIKTDTAEVIASSSAEIPDTWSEKPAPAQSAPAESEPAVRQRKW